MIRIIWTFFLSLFLLLFSQPALSKEISQKSLDNLATKISKKFSRTYCNTSNFGISKEGAMEFAIGETYKEFSKNKLIKFLDVKDINAKIVLNVEKECQIYDFPVDGLSKFNLAEQK